MRNRGALSILMLWLALSLLGSPPANAQAPADPLQNQPSQQAAQSSGASASGNPGQAGLAPGQPIAGNDSSAFGNDAKYPPPPPPPPLPPAQTPTVLEQTKAGLSDKWEQTKLWFNDIDHRKDLTWALTFALAPLLPGAINKWSEAVAERNLIKSLLPFLKYELVEEGFVKRRLPHLGGADDVTEPSRNFWASPWSPDGTVRRKDQPSDSTTLVIGNIVSGGPLPPILNSTLNSLAVARSHSGSGVSLQFSGSWGGSSGGGINFVCGLACQQLGQPDPFAGTSLAGRAPVGPSGKSKQSLNNRSVSKLSVISASLGKSTLNTSTSGATGRLSTTGRSVTFHKLALGPTPGGAAAVRAAIIHTPHVRTNIYTPNVRTPNIRTSVVRVPTVRTPTVRTPTVNVRVPTVRVPTVRVPTVTVRVPNVTVRVPSDVRLKRDIVELGELSNGLRLYRYRYAWSDTIYVGVMAQQVLAVAPEVVTRGKDGYLRVDYRRLGLKLLTWADWAARRGQYSLRTH